MSPREPQGRRPDPSREPPAREPLAETLEGAPDEPTLRDSRGRPARASRSSGRSARRHPDIEVARLLVKRGFVAKAPAVEALRTQKARAKAGKPRVAFLRLLVRTGVLDEARLAEAQDEVRRHTYICEACDARTVILADSETRAGACPRCGHEISVDPQTDPRAVPAREFQGTDATQASEGVTARWRGGPPGLVGNPAAKRLAAGEVVFDKYLLQEELGRGAMGVVYRARHIGLNKDVALKVLVPTDDNREHQVARFRREAAAVQKLRHAGIIAVHDFGGDGELYYLTMDLVQGGESLHRALKRREEPLPLRRRLELMVEVGHAVGHAHERGVVHRDLKPANVLIDPEGRALVADFGLAKDEDDEAAELTRTHDRLGTPLFMAPEQIRRGAAQVDGRADVWALGVMLFVCATGRYPFRSRTVMDLYLRIMKDDPDWTGTRYSAPDQPGLTVIPTRDSSASSAGASSAGSSSAGASSAGARGAAPAPTDDRTEVDKARVKADGSLPKTLPLPRGTSDQPLTPPPFAPPPEVVGREVPRDLRRIIECALSKRPEDRYATAEELALDLERFLADRPVEARRPALLTRLGRAVWRRRVLARLALGATGLAVVLGALLGVQAWRRAGDAQARQRVDALWASTGAQGAYQDFEERLARAPDLAGRAEALLYQGVARTRLLRWGEAAAALERAARAAAAAGDDGLVGRVAVERAHHALVSGDAAAALGLALEAARHDLPDPRPPLYAGVAALALGDAAALRRVDPLVRGPPGAPAPQLVACAARLALARGRLDEARARLPAPQDDEWFDLTLARGALALAERDVARAQPLFGRVREKFVFRELRGGDAEVSYYNSQGYGLLVDRDLRGALLADDAAAALSPWHPGPLYYSARVLLGGYADPAAALPYLRRTLERDPFHGQARDWAAGILSAGPAPDLEGALALVREELALVPDLAAPRLTAAALELRAGRAERAWDLLDEAERLAGGREALARGVASGRQSSCGAPWTWARGAAAADGRRGAPTCRRAGPRRGQGDPARGAGPGRGTDAGDTRAALGLARPLVDGLGEDRAQDAARAWSPRARAIGSATRPPSSSAGSAPGARSARCRPTSRPRPCAASGSSSRCAATSASRRSWTSSSGAGRRRGRDARPPRRQRLPPGRARALGRRRPARGARRRGPRAPRRAGAGVPRGRRGHGRAARAGAARPRPGRRAPARRDLRPRLDRRARRLGARDAPRPGGRRAAGGLRAQGSLPLVRPRGAGVRRDRRARRRRRRPLRPGRRRAGPSGDRRGRPGRPGAARRLPRPGLHARAPARRRAAVTRRTAARSGLPDARASAARRRRVAGRALTPAPCAVRRPVARRAGRGPRRARRPVGRTRRSGGRARLPAAARPGARPRRRPAARALPGGAGALRCARRLRPRMLGGRRAREARSMPIRRRPRARRLASASSPSPHVRLRSRPVTRTRRRASMASYRSPELAGERRRRSYAPSYSPRSSSQVSPSHWPSRGWPPKSTTTFRRRS
ncbi:MAG: serine/threonine protein kinase [Planctomycetes bacterium]|nr:serine/threonine protein kinase [Planctomycetota bacterium]